MMTAPALDEAVDNVLGNAPGTLVIDLTEVQFLGSMGMASLLRAHRLAGESTVVRVVATGRRIAGVLTMTGLDHELSIHSSRDEALVTETPDVH